ncbi:hypothetical protein [Methylobacterium sp. CM6244]
MSRAEILAYARAFYEYRLDDIGRADGELNIFPSSPGSCVKVTLNRIMGWLSNGA